MIDLPRSTYYYRSTAKALSLGDSELVAIIEDIQDELPSYGYRRVTYELQRRGHLVNHKRVARVMRWDQASEALRSHDRQQPRFTDLPELIPQRDPAAARYGLGGRLHIHPHHRRLLLPRCHSRRLQPESCGLCAVETPGHAAGIGSFAFRAREPKAASRLHSPHGPRVPICK